MQNMAASNKVSEAEAPSQLAEFLVFNNPGSHAASSPLQTDTSASNSGSNNLSGASSSTSASVNKQPAVRKRPPRPISRKDLAMNMKLGEVLEESMKIAADIRQIKQQIGMAPHILEQWIQFEQEKKYRGYIRQFNKFMHAKE